MMNKFSQKSGGYSLMELVIYIGLFALLSVVMMRSLVTVMKTYASAKTYRTLQTNGELIMERISREARAATNITSGTYNTNPGSVTFSGVDSNNAVHTASFDVSSGTLQINDNGTIGNISTNDVTVTSLIFRNMTTTKGSAIKVELSLTTTKGNIANANFYSTVVLRGQ